MKGSSTSKWLHGLVLKVQDIEMKAGLKLKLHIVHVSGRHMIAQGTDGLSRGVLLEGVLAGRDMLDYVDLSRTAFERHPALSEFVRSWTEDDKLCPLEPVEWFEKAHGMKGFVQNAHGVWIPEHVGAGKIYL